MYDLQAEKLEKPGVETRKNTKLCGGKGEETVNLRYPVRNNQEKENVGRQLTSNAGLGFAWNHSNSLMSGANCALCADKLRWLSLQPVIQHGASMKTSNMIA